MSHEATHHEATSKETKGHLRGSSLLLFGRMISLALNFAVQVLIVRYLSKEGYGAFAYGYSIAILASRVTPLGIDKAVSRFVPIYHEENNLQRLKGTLILVVGTTLVTGVLLVGSTIALRNVLSGTLVQDPLALSVLLMIISLAPLASIENTLEKLLAIFGRVKTIFVRRHIITPVLRLLAVSSLIAVSGDAVYLAIAYVTATFLGVVITCQILWRVFREDGLLSQLSEVRAELPAKRLFRFGMPLLSTDFVFGLRTSLVVILLEVFHGTTGVAAFRAVLPVARLNQVVFDSFRLLYVPTASRMFARGEADAIGALYWRSSAWIGMLTLPVFFASFSLATPTVVQLFGESYASSGPVLSVLALGIYLNSAFGFNSLTLRVFDRVGSIFRIDLAAGLLALILNVIAVPWYGPMGGAIVSCLVLIGQNVAYQVAVTRAGQLSRIPIDVALVHALILGLALLLLGIQQWWSPPIYVGFLLAALLSIFVWSACFRTLEIQEHFPELGRFLPKWFDKSEGRMAAVVATDRPVTADQGQS